MTEKEIDLMNDVMKESGVGIKKINSKELPPYNLHVYSAGCSWHGPISEVGHTTGRISIPCCPFCGAVLFQTDENEWWTGVLVHEKTHENYEKFLRWTLTKKKCWPTLAEAAQVFSNENKLPVRLESKLITPQ